MTTNIQRGIDRGGDRTPFRNVMENARRIGVSVFVIPRAGRPSGQAFGSHLGRPDDGSFDRFINVEGDPGDPIALFVLAHEVAHHLLGHMTIRHCTPAWAPEKSADDMALRLIREAAPETYEACEAFAKAHIRGLVQAYIDWDMIIHVDLAVADWAGCRVPKPMRKRIRKDLVARMLYGRLKDVEVVF